MNEFGLSELGIVTSVSLLIVLLMGERFIRFLENCGIVGNDINKKGKPVVAEMGGPLVISGFVFSIFFFIWYMIFWSGAVSMTQFPLVNIFAGISTILIITIIGIFDDLSTLQKRREGGKGFEKYKRAGLAQWQKPLLTLPAAIPLMAIMAGDSTMTFPLIGQINFGVLYPLLVIPIGVVGASNAMNMLAGFNGLEAGLGFVLLSGMGAYGFVHGEMAAAVIAFTMAAALLAFLKFNWYPARIFPGDSLAYAIGATAAVVAIIGNMEKFAIYIFVPWFLEFLLKLRSGMKAENYGILQSDGTLKSRYEKIYSLTHLVMKLGRFREWQISLIIILFELAVVSTSFFLFQ